MCSHRFARKAVLLACLENQPSRKPTWSVLAGNTPESGRIARAKSSVPVDWPARHPFATYHKPYVLVETMIWLVTVSAFLQDEQSRRTAPAGTLATRLNKNCQAHLQVGRPAIRSKHMRQISALLVFGREYKGIGPLRSRYCTSQTISELQSWVWSFGGVFL